MSKERLEEIKERYMEHEYDYALSAMDIDWLIEQAERVQELEELLIQEKYDKNLFNARTKEWIKMKQQNKRYREALEEIAQKRMTYADMAGVLLIARKALEGEE